MTGTIPVNTEVYSLAHDSMCQTSVFYPTTNSGFWSLLSFQVLYDID